MANKNTLAARRANEKSARTGNKEVISKNIKDNTQMIVAHECDANGKVIGSMTRHIPIDGNRPSFFRRRPKSPKGSIVKSE